MEISSDSWYLEQHFCGCSWAWMLRNNRNFLNYRTNYLHTADQTLCTSSCEHSSPHLLASPWVSQHCSAAVNVMEWRHTKGSIKLTSLGFVTWQHKASWWLFAWSLTQPLAGCWSQQRVWGCHRAGQLHLLPGAKANAAWPSNLFPLLF